MGYPAAVGVLWHVSDKVAIRPELSFAGSSNETSTSTGTLPEIQIEGDGWSIGTGVSALFYLRKADRLRTYVSPRFTYSHASNTTTTTGLPVTNPRNETSTNAVGFSGSFGAQYAVGDRFSIYGELGFGISHSSSKSSNTPTRGSGNSWGLRSGVGVVFYP
jgi:opacity protein-like surface antigen